MISGPPSKVSLESCEASGSGQHLGLGQFLPTSGWHCHFCGTDTGPAPAVLWHSTGEAGCAACPNEPKGSALPCTSPMEDHQNFTRAVAVARLLQGLTLVIRKQNSPAGQTCLEHGRWQIVLKNQTPKFSHLPPRQRPERGTHPTHRRRQVMDTSRAVCWF